MTSRENFLRALEFRYPEWIPCTVSLPHDADRAYGKALADLRDAYPSFFDPHTRPNPAGLFTGVPPAYSKGYFTDSWGCLWHNELDGFEGQVVGHPLAEWSRLKDYRPPDPRATRKNEWGRKRLGLGAHTTRDREKTNAR